MFDTHCHLNDPRLNGNLEKIIHEAKNAGVNLLLVPGYDLNSSYEAVRIAKANKKIYAAVGIHPQRVYKYWKSRTMNNKKEEFNAELQQVEKLICKPFVVAVGEVGLDHYYCRNPKSPKFEVDTDLLALQKYALTKQIELAVKYDKSLILHSRKTTDDLLSVLAKANFKNLCRRVVFHCCEADSKLLEFAKNNNVFIGVDGDVTYSKTKQNFVLKIPPSLLVLETDSPYLLPEPARARKDYPNQPKNLVMIARQIAKLKKTSLEEITEITTVNAKKLFNITSNNNFA